MMIAKRLSRESGQSTAELAMMMPVVLAFFFWGLQVNIIMFAYHQTAYASFMSARALLVSHNTSSVCGSDCPTTVMNAILTGDLYQGSGANGTGNTFQKVKLTATVRGGTGGKDDSEDQQDFGQNQPTGVQIQLGAINSLPYMDQIDFATFSAYVPTHLGASVWNQTLYPDTYRDQDASTPCYYTDNNTKDNCSS
jgi:hypothetical protein